MRRYAEKLRRVLLLTVFALLLTSTCSHAAGRSTASVRKLLAKYESWMHKSYGDDTLQMTCPDYDLSEKEIMRFVVDIAGLLKGAVGEDACSVIISFRYHGEEYNNDFDTFVEQHDGLQEKLAYAWPYWGCTDSQHITRIGSGDDEFINRIVLELNGLNASEAYLAKLKQIVADGRAAAGNDARAMALYFIDWLLDNVEYDASEAYLSSEGAVMHGKTICQGFACAFYDLCTVAGIPALVPTSDKLNHAWNEVYFDGQWYTFDMLNVVWSVSDAGRFFTDPDGFCDDPDFMRELERQLVNPVPFPLTKGTVDLNNKAVNIRNYLGGLTANATIRCSSSNPSAIGTDLSGAVVPTDSGTAKISVTVQQNGTSYQLEMNFTNKKPAPKKGKVLTEEKTKASYVVTKAGSTVAYKAPANKKAVSVTIPATVKIDGITYKVTSISDRAFSGNRKLKKVTIGKNVEKIGISAFQNCTALKKVTIPAKVTSIGKKAFYNCRNMTSIVINTKKLKLKKVGSAAFAQTGCGNYKKLTVKTPKKNRKEYKSILLKRGLSNKAKIK